MPLGLSPLAFNLARIEPSVAPPLACAPPPWFKAAEGVRAAWPAGDGPFGAHPSSRAGGTPAMKAGRRYERRALAHLQEVLGSDFRSSQWFRYVGESGIRYCQVDGLLHCEALTSIFEVKVTFTSDAWWQLRKQYEPVVRKAFLPNRLVLVVVCKSFDPAAPFPEPVEHLKGLNRQLLEESGGPILVYSWRP